MPGDPVTHEQLRAGQMALIDRFAAHETHFREVSGKLFEKVDRAIDASYENRIHIAAVQSSLASMNETRAGHLARFETMERKVGELERADNIQAGERGAWAAIIRSPFVAWLAAGFLAVWAFVSNAGVKP